MICNTRTGILISGQIGRNPELRYVGQHQRLVLKFSVRYGSEIPEGGGRAAGKYIDVDVWDNAEALDGMLKQGDAVIVIAREIKTREYNSKIYKTISAEGLFPAAGTVLRWLQQTLDMLQPQTGPDAEGPQTTHGGHAPAVGTSIAGGEMYLGETLDDYAPRNAAQKQTAPAAQATDDDNEYLISGDPEDLPF